MSWLRRRARPNVPLLPPPTPWRVRPFKQFGRVLMPRYMDIWRGRRGVLGRECARLAAAQSPAPCGSRSSAPACVKRGQKNPPDEAAVGGESGQLVAGGRSGCRSGCRSGRDGGGISPDRPGPPGA